MSKLHWALPLLLVGCATVEVKEATLVNPDAGATMTCRESSRPDPISAAMANSRFESCLKTARAQGYK